MIGFVFGELSDETWKRHADRMMDAMFDEGVLPARNRLTGGESCIFAAEKKAEGGWNLSEPIGMAVVYQPEGQDMFWLDLLYVEPNWRGMGIGFGLVGQAIWLAGQRGFPAIEVGTMLFNKPMIKLAQKAGFGEATVYFRQEIS